MAKLSLKQREFWKDYCIHHNLAHAAKHAGSKGSSSHSLSQAGWLILKSLELSMPELLDAQGLTDEKVNRVLINGLESKHVVVATYKGQIGEEKAYEDRPTQAKYLEIYHRLRGNFIDRHELSGKDGGDIILQINSSKGRQRAKTIKLDTD